jgi:hypothetical protein
MIEAIMGRAAQMMWFSAVFVWWVLKAIIFTFINMSGRNRR